MRVAILACLLVLAACATKSTPTPGNGTPDGADYPQAADQCLTQPTSPWCKPR